MADDRTDHERINRVVFSEAQRVRVESERPAEGVPIATDSGWMLAAYRMPNGSRFVTLVNGSEAVWQAYCAEVRVRKGIAQAGDIARSTGAELTHAEKVAVWNA